MTQLHPPTNEILASLPHAEAGLTRPHLRRVRLVSGQVLTEQGHAVEHVYFVEEGVISLVAEAHPARPGVQVGMVGKEGFVGGGALLDPACATTASAVVQIPGRALRMASHELLSLQAECPELWRRCFAAMSALFQQVMQVSASNACGSLLERCARWLLMAHERVEFADIYITHEALSNALGVRRSGVSVVLANLQEAKFINVHRGRIVICDRPGIERILMDGTRQASGPLNSGRLFETHVAGDSPGMHCGESIT